MDEVVQCGLLSDMTYIKYQQDHNMWMFTSSRYVISLTKVFLCVWYFGRNDITKNIK